MTVRLLFSQPAHFISVTAELFLFDFGEDITIISIWSYFSFIYRYLKLC